MRTNTVLKEKAIKNYKGAVYKIINDIFKLRPQYANIDDLLKNEDLVEMKKEWLSIPENKELDVRGHGMYSAGLNKLIDFAKYTYFDSQNN